MSEVEERLQAARTAFDDALDRLVGDNAGEDCVCNSCNEKRDGMRGVVTELVEAFTAALTLKDKRP